MSLLSLPNELLVVIFENPQFPSDLLCILAVSCRRLHYLALPIYFARNGMPAQSKSAVIMLQEDGRDMLAALNMALFLSSMEDMTVILPHPSCVSIYPLLPHLLRVRTFVSRFAALGHFTLQFDASTCNTMGDDGALRAWSCALCDLLNAAVERCTELTVEYGRYLTRSYTFKPKTTQGIRRLVKALRRFVKPRDTLVGPDWEFRRSADQGRASVHRTIKASSAPKLTCLHIQSAILILPPCLNWTISMFSSNAITALSIANISLERHLWDPVLTLIARAAPTLTNVTLSGLEYITGVEILGFCKRIPRLTTLEIGLNEETRGVAMNPDGPFPEFVHLASLKAPPNFILYLLRPQPCFPKLQALSIAFHGSRDIRTIAARLVAIGDAMQERRIYPVLSLSVPLLSDSDLRFDVDAVVKLPHEYKKALGLVDKLDLQVSPSNAAQIALWVNLFPSARQITISLTLKLEAGMEMLFEEFARDLSIPRTVTINGTTRTLECII